MKIIKAGKVPEKVKRDKRFECLKCGCVFDAEEGEYKCEEFYGYSAQCPCCGEMTGRVVNLREKGENHGKNKK